MVWTGGLADRWTDMTAYAYEKAKPGTYRGWLWIHDDKGGLSEPFLLIIHIVP